MSVLSGKKVLLGVTAGIAAYKTAYIVRLFIKAGAEVRVVMTPEAKEFVTPLTLSTLSKNEVISSFTNEEGETWNNHVDLGLWADFMLIAPATANSLSKMANGHSDNILLATYLSAKCPVYFAPAMDLDMYKHPSTKKSIQQLESFQNKMIPVGSGELASGLSGEGRMAEPDEIIQFIENDLKSQLPLYRKKILITAGPTYEAIDPVRYIGNHSSGKMGYALAEAAAGLGAEVILVSGPTALQVKHQNVKLIRVTSAQEMYEEVHAFYAEVDVAIAAAAVSDYRPRQVASQKIKKDTAEISIELEKTKDILLSLGEAKKDQFLIGFALETENEVENAKGKLKRKNLDFIVLNSLNDKGAGFKESTNKIRIIYPDQIKEFGLKTKQEVAKDILNEVIYHYED
ncbi:MULTISPECIES: bifunctional phosphopantothenoylcysteine decarboxylase/phosphopantothenate--cysteine ligase CoaBC [Mesonia]|uniref:Coenzyme A biosynthesis bifunctional protein CoaBC n=1 Tax=Mesonia oceanica TaxID=2687242 RepID=A0AC61YCE1_9FLAO|nr:MULTISPECIES: bifunctional phosphopantothenoylcysteine decarboxylase/phosphopantothenate--cysteine ligase CoaBC [Mesonia]MAN29285.1 bifunctional phosphopantothenoylcysteine decarboxylase/phosphopantothenate--cysteine ligase CoaBC [Mesonia sp.]MAQ39891.1 bifunctional phosphopantothenoylcysteine decarboxylase/phosphopantothenate--cysteine ligase CoaBC [Mesonia sp.]MBJ99025.1 bifunctional phosphopantothenoylcysteine decarboxylase/phosphopantothenate--cysteine ligase CoaBC [Flavobacteriaceae bact|tara:strand:- start:8297 stop:9499 length:1203 start_codon:yes stop_codon:yes gene_type:complete